MPSALSSGPVMEALHPRIRRYPQLNCWQLMHSLWFGMAWVELLLSVQVMEDL